MEAVQKSGELWLQQERVVFCRWGLTGNLAQFTGRVEFPVAVGDRQFEDLIQPAPDLLRYFEGLSFLDA